MTRRLAIGFLTLLAAAVCAHAAQPDWLRAAAYADHEAVPQGGTLRVAVVIELDAGYHINANPPSQKDQIPTVLTPPTGTPVHWGDVRYPPGRPFAPKWAPGESIAVYAGRATLLVEGTVADDAPPGPLPLRLRLDYQGCSDDACYQPASREVETGVRIVAKGDPAVPANAAVFAEAAAASGSIQGSTAGQAGPGTQAAREAIHFEGETDLGAAFERGLLGYLATLFLFGLLLNLTPCVFPLIPVTMTVFTQQGESRPAKVLPLAILYVAGLAATFTGVGVVASLAGKSLGFILQQPFGVLGVVTVLAIMMASAFGAFDIRLPSGLMGRLGLHRGLAGALVAGLVMGLVASPCVGPFMIALITFVATKGSVWLGAVSFLATGLGLGLPYLFLGMFTSLINRFPRGGGWLIWTKRLMGLALAGLILYYVRPYVAEAFFWPLVLGAFIFAAVYLALLEGLDRRPFSRTFWAVRLAAGAAILAAGALVYADATRERPEVLWTPWRPGALEAAQAQKKPVLLYFGADWCIACKEWHASVFTDPAVVKASASVERIYVDVTRPPQGDLKAFAERFQGINPPVVVVFGRDGKVVKAWRNPVEAAAVVAALRQATGS